MLSIRSQRLVCRRNDFLGEIISPLQAYSTFYPIISRVLNVGIEAFASFSYPDHLERLSQELIFGCCTPKTRTHTTSEK